MPTRHFIKVYFHNKGIDKVNLTNNLHNKLVRSKVPIYFQEQDPAFLSYTYTKNISRNVFNLIIIKPPVTLISVIIVIHLHRVDCQSSAFRYEPHGHVNSITGDLRIVQNRKVRCLLKKGPKLGNRIPSTGTLPNEY